MKNKPKVKEAKEVKLEPKKINTPKKTTKVTVSRRDQRRLDEATLSEKLELLKLERKEKQL